MRDGINFFFFLARKTDHFDATAGIGQKYYR